MTTANMTSKVKVIKYGTNQTSNVCPFFKFSDIIYEDSIKINSVILFLKNKFLLKFKCNLQYL